MWGMSELRRSEGRNGRTGRPSRAILALLIVTLAGVAACSGTQHSKTSGATPGNLAATAGFSSPTTASSDPANVPGVVGYLFADPASVTFLQWRADSTGNLQGTENSASATGTPPDASVRTGTTSFSGRTNGTSVTLDVGLHTDQGVLSGTNLTLNVIQTDGSIRPIAYRQATPSDYNQALAALNATVQHADAQAGTPMTKPKRSARWHPTIRVWGSRNPASRMTCPALALTWKLRATT